MKIVFQDTELKLSDVYKSCEALKELGEEIISFGLMSFTDTIVNWDYTDIVIPFGSTKLIKLWLTGILPKNAIIYYDEEKFKQSYYQLILKHELINSNAKFIKYSDIKHWIIDQSIFIKPSSDLKYFSGCIIHPQDYTVESEIYNRYTIDSSLDDDTEILYNTDINKDIANEYRTFVVNNIIVDTICYITDNVIKETTISNDAKIKVQNYVKYIQTLFEPSSHYVIDVCSLISGEFKVIEFNCIHCSGMYNIDRKQLFKELLKNI